MKIQILGVGCPKCKKLAANAEAAARELGVDYTLEKVTDIAEIMKFGVMVTPALVVDGEVKTAGKAPSAPELKEIRRDRPSRLDRAYLSHEGGITMENQKQAECCAAAKLIFACSGAADVGAIADRAARRLTKEGAGKMFCLAGVGGCVSGIIKSTEAASKILVVDGCELDCAKSCLELAGFTGFEHIRVTDMGMEKGKTQVNDQNIAKVVSRGTELLAD